MLTSREISDWMAFERLEPFPDRRGDDHAALISKTIADVNRDPNKSRPTKLEDFHLDYERAALKGTRAWELRHGEERLAAWKAYAARNKEAGS